LVSFHPEKTQLEYDLQALQFLPSEELETPSAESAAVTSYHQLGNGSEVEVMTLCLTPNHWFYVEGVRVHNKGCFTAGSQILLSDGSWKQLQDVRVGDTVASWDDTANQPATSVVQGLPSFTRPSDELFEVSLSTGSRPAGAAGALNVTDDHPFWSHGRGSLVQKQVSLIRQEVEVAHAS